MRGRELCPGNREFATTASGANDDLVCRKPQPALGLDSVRIGKASHTAQLINSYAEAIQLRAKGRVCSDVFNDFPYASEQTRVVEPRLADSNAIPLELARVAH